MPQNTSPIQVRTRGTRAFVTVACSDGQPHRFSIELDGTSSNTFHAPDEDAVITALGGQPSACGTILRVFSIVRHIHAAQAGVRDIPGLRYGTRRGWYQRNGIEVPTRSGFRNHISMRQASSIPFQLNAHGIPHDYRRAANTMLSWIARNSEPLIPIETNETLAALGVEVPARFTNYALQWQLITPAFVTAAKDLVGPKIIKILELRQEGLTVQWITELAETLTARAKRRLRRRDGIARALGCARNLNPRLVARFLERGIYSHIHTYVRASATPDQVLAVFQASNGERTLATLLEQGMTVTDAVARYGQSR